MKKFLKVGAGLCRNNGCIQFIFNKKSQSSTRGGGLSWLLIQTITWWGDFSQVGACGVKSYPGL